jgi:hypothetical protein
MRKELETKLREDFPTLFNELQDPCCIDDGWELLLRRLCRDIQHDKTVRFKQIKEKYGGLRAYTTGGTAEIDEKVDQAEEESFQTFESCGKKGELAATASGWDFTACQGCFDLANGVTSA